MVSGPAPVCSLFEYLECALLVEVAQQRQADRETEQANRTEQLRAHKQACERRHRVQAELAARRSWAR